MNNNSKVIVGLSGGVDSSVTAYLLKERGYNVIGVTMEVWNMGEHNKAIEDAKNVADALGIEHHVIDFKEAFRKEVVDYFVSSYINGRTPNPCVVCNRRIKWEALLNRCREFGADYVATGHYARIEKLNNGRYSIKNSVTAVKDQTYALYNLTQQQLEHTMMPIGEFTKDEIRNIAMNAKIPVADKPDSQEICFIPDNDYVNFIKREYPNLEIRKGNFVWQDGSVVGKHNGIINYTIGQRKGLGVTFGKPVFVTDIRPDSNEVVLGDGTDVFENELYAENINCMAIPEFTDNMTATAKIRYSHKGQKCTINKEGDKLHVIFDEPVRAVTPGQAVVFYDGEYVLGGGMISRKND